MKFYKHISNRTASRDKEKGNVLFLILIAVVLFAALSYAVTQSSRGGGNVDKEQIALKVSQFMQQATLISQTVQRKYILGFNGQIQFTSAAETDSGTIYKPDRSAATGRIVGFFTPDVSGMNTMVALAELKHQDYMPIVDQGWSIVYNTSLMVDGSDIGTSSGDEFVLHQFLSEEACIEINKGLHDTSSLGSVTSSGGMDASSTEYRPNGNVFSTLVSSFQSVLDIEFLPGCNSSGSGPFANHMYFELIKSR